MTGASGPSEEVRQRAVDVLCEAFAEDLVSVEEFERRIEAAHRAASEEELRRLLSDLPRSPPVPERGEEASRDVAGARPASDVRPVGASADRSHGLPALAAPHEVADHAVVMGVLGGGGRAGRWIPARTNWTLGVMGGVSLDFRDAVFPPGVTEVRVFAFWGGVEIVAPPTVRVEVSGLGLMGGFGHNQTVAPSDDPDAPVLRVTGVACMAGVDVTVRYPGESSGDARRRLKAERKERKRLLSG